MTDKRLARARSKYRAHLRSIVPDSDAYTQPTHQPPSVPFCTDVSNMSKPQATLSVASQLKVTARAQEAFLRHGYEAMTMVTLAAACGLTRRALYYYFSSKDEAFRAMIRLENDRALELGRLAAQKVLDGKRPNALAAITAWMDARYGETRRKLSTSPFGKEINDAAFVICADIMVEYATLSHDELAKLLRLLQKQRLLKLNRPASPESVGRLLADGARGVNQTRPPIPNSALAERYQEISGAILYGMAQKL
ncbi:MAG: TetR/AcrR family transcriptional regulator [Rhizomicrobium sp.]